MRKKMIWLSALACGLVCCATARAQEEDEFNALGDVIGDMQVAGGRLGKLLTDRPTQQRQKDAVDKLDALIKLLEERRRQQGGSVNPNPSKPADESNIRNGPGGSGPLHAARRNGANWGQLPAHKRQQILQSMTEGFPPHYQQILERYFQRLAEEKSASEITGENGPPTDPPKNSPTAIDKKPSAEETR